MRQFCESTGRKMESLTEVDRPKRGEISSKVGHELLEIEPLVFIDNTVAEKTIQYVNINPNEEMGGIFVGRVFSHRGESIIDICDIVPDHNAMSDKFNIKFSKQLRLKAQDIVDEKNKTTSDRDFSPYRILGDFHSHPSQKVEGESDSVAEYLEGKPTLPNDPVAGLRSLGNYSPSLENYDPYNIFVIVRMRDNKLIPYRYFLNPEISEVKENQVIYSDKPEEYYHEYEGYITD